ncbi:uncharacterized protein LOC117735684 [Cyclopterus lumpus]|uniref:uncharacterized protein LOC117735684 n=1 Tax=Cyclopterus lumpus TaxID=8103 RepID=UPI001486C8F7|nr:uncharacterized protein LOC117735684 [Cyclopterus lumpus]
MCHSSAFWLYHHGGRGHTCWAICRDDFPAGSHHDRCLPLRLGCGMARGGAQHLGSLWQGKGGSLCLREVNPLPPLGLLDGEDQSSRSRCPGPHMARGPSLCFPSISPDLANASQGPSTGPQSFDGGPVVASQDLVSPVAQTLPRDAMAPPRQEGPPIAARGSDLASRPQPPLSVGLAVAGPNRLLSGCTELVRKTILNARVPSTCLQYECRWRLFSDWCVGHNEDPVQCPVPVILEFLQSLLEKGRSPSTLRVYVAAISWQHVKIYNDTVGSYRLVSLFLKGAQRLHPPSTPRAPPWYWTPYAHLLSNPWRRQS